MAQTLLIVEDDSSFRYLLLLSLRQAGFTVYGASGGQEALEILKRVPCDCMITDAKMEPMSGFTLASSARELRPKLRILMISASYGPSDVEGLPIERFMVKPVSAESVAAWAAGNRV